MLQIILTPDNEGGGGGGGGEAIDPDSLNDGGAEQARR